MGEPGPGPLLRSALPAAGVRLFLTARGHGLSLQPEGGMGVRDVGLGAHGLPLFRGQLVAFRGIAIASFVPALLLSVTIETPSGGVAAGAETAAEGFFHPPFYLCVWHQTAIRLILSHCLLLKLISNSTFSQ